MSGNEFRDSSASGFVRSDSPCPEGEELLWAMVLGGELIHTPKGWRLTRDAPDYAVEWLLEDGLAVQECSGNVVRASPRGRKLVEEFYHHVNRRS